ncbi:unnamed protein product [Phytomonas sp. Hart1]|nr:unnamed protein product [Phytomonas sp. Hart1]|eukprot:CCW70821.1 unnamed protein product [Phytomonas sp. isolate Hart1]
MDSNALQDAFLMPTKNVLDNKPIESRYLLLDCLGKGSYGTVWKAQNIQTKKVFAIKKVDKTRVGTKGLQELMGEVESMSMLSHPNIVKLEETYQDDSNLWIIMEYLACGTLDQMLKKKGSLSEASIKNIVTQLLLALEYIHSKGIVHRDLKPANCLISEDGSTVKISDFGFAVLAGSEQCLTTYCGTISFMAPEILMKLNYGKKVDMWALGILTYLLFSGEYPFKGDNSSTLRREICANHSWVNRNKQLKEVPQLYDFINRLLRFEPIKRMTARESLQHQWIKSRMNSFRDFVSFAPCLPLGEFGTYSPGGIRLVSRFRSAVVAILAVHRLVYWQRCRRLEKLGYGHISVLRNLHYFVTKCFEPKWSGKPVFYCGHMFAQCPMAITELLPMVAASKSIEELNLSHNNINSLSLVQDILLTVAHHPSVEVINLSYNPIPAVAGRGLLRLARNTSSKLRRIEVIGTPIAIDVVKQLSTLLKEKNAPITSVSTNVSTTCTSSAGKAGSYFSKRSTKNSTIPRLPIHNPIHSSDTALREQPTPNKKLGEKDEIKPDQLPYIMKSGCLHSTIKRNLRLSNTRKD